MFNEYTIDYGAERSPSPEPIYDTQGKRVNTRDQRAKDKLLEERQKSIEMATAMWPGFRVCYLKFISHIISHRLITPLHPQRSYVKSLFLQRNSLNITSLVLSLVLVVILKSVWKEKQVPKFQFVERVRLRTVKTRKTQ